jgi:hypothetical protein
MATDITAITDSVNKDVGAGRAHSFRGLFSDAIPFSASILDATIPAQGGAQCDIDVVGAALGDFVLLSGPAVDTTGLIFYASVTAANVVTITAFNVEGTDANTTLATTARNVNGLVLKAGGPWNNIT